jgi:hypothetical protein
MIGFANIKVPNLENHIILVILEPGNMTKLLLMAQYNYFNNKILTRKVTVVIFKITELCEC